MTNREEQFNLLGIEPTDDVRAIKRAYAKKAAEVHPEEHPDQWEKIHSAYTELVKNAGNNRGNTANAGIVINSGLNNPSSGYASENGGNGAGYYDDGSDDSDVDDVFSEKIAEIVGNSYDYSLQKKLSEEMLRLLKKLPSPRASFYGELAINEDAMEDIRKHNDYIKALTIPEFFDSYETILTTCAYPSKIAQTLLEDIEAAEESVKKGKKSRKKNNGTTGITVDTERYESLKNVLQSKISQAEDFEKKETFKGKFYAGGFLTWLFRDIYNINDYVRYGGNYAVVPNSNIFLKKNHTGLQVRMVIKGAPYSVMVDHNTTNAIYSVYRLWAADYDTPLQCLEACKSISDYYEMQYKKHRVGRFLRQASFAVLDASLAVSVLLSLVLIVFDFGKVALLFLVLHFGVVFMYKMFTVMGFDKRKFGK